jgi:hypothetical protein
MRSGRTVDGKRRYRLRIGIQQWRQKPIYTYKQANKHALYYIASHCGETFICNSTQLMKTCSAFIIYWNMNVMIYDMRDTLKVWYIDLMFYCRY